MKSILRNYLSAVLLSALTLLLLLIGCKQDFLNNDDIIEGATTITLFHEGQSVDNVFNARISDNKAYLQGSGQRSVYFANIGSIKSLADIKRIPLGDLYDFWREPIPVFPGDGYIAYANGQYYRIFVVGVGEGVTLQYQKPFYGADEEILLEETSITINPNEYRNSVVQLQNTSLIPITIESSSEWCSIDKQPSYDNRPVNSFRFTCKSNSTAENRKATLTLKTHYGKTKTIEVTQTALAGSLVANPTSLSFPAQSKTENIQVSSNFPWTATSNADWCVPSKDNYSSSSLKVQVEANNSEQSRTAQITITTTANEKAVVEVMQAGATLSVSAASIDAPATSYSSQTITVTSSSSNWSAISDQSWCVVNKRSYYDWFEVNIAESTTGSVRTATISVSLGDITRTIQVTQAGATLSVSATSLNIPKTAVSSQEITVTSSSNNWSAISDQSWCVVNKKSSSSNSRLEVSIVENTTGSVRTATISVSLGDITRTIQVTQGRWGIGDYYQKDNIEGVVFEVTGDHGKIVSMGKSGALAWSTESVETGAMNSSDGSANMGRIKLMTDWQSKYPIFNWCEQRNTNGVSGWYVPSKDELGKIMSNKTAINATLIAYPSGSPIVNDLLWSSTENDSFYAYFLSPQGSSIKKSITGSVRAVMKF